MYSNLLKLYHGTDKSSVTSILDNGIDFSYCREGLDFGKGFYTTTDINQAWRWAKRKSESAVVSFYCDTSKLKILNFTAKDVFWGNMIYNNRVNGVDVKGYDVISGPMADGVMRRELTLAKQNVISKVQFISNVSKGDIGYQFVLKTNTAINALSLGMEVGNDDIG